MNFLYKLLLVLCQLFFTVSEKNALLNFFSPNNHNRLSLKKQKQLLLSIKVYELVQYLRIHLIFPSSKPMFIVHVDHNHFRLITSLTSRQSTRATQTFRQSVAEVRRAKTSSDRTPLVLLCSARSALLLEVYSFSNVYKHIKC